MRGCGSEGRGRAGGEVSCEALSAAAVASYPNAGAAGGRGFPLPRNKCGEGGHFHPLVLWSLDVGRRHGGGVSLHKQHAYAKGEALRASAKSLLQPPLPASGVA